MTEDNSKIEYWLGRLQSGSPRERVNSLRSIADQPVADQRLLEACEALLTDHTMTVLSLPYTFGEVRWCAAEAVVSLREVLGIDLAVVLSEAFAPCSTTQIGDLARAAGLPLSPGGLDGALHTLETLSSMARLPRRTVTRTPDAAKVKQ